MPAITTNDLKNGITLELDGVLFQVVEFQHVKPGKGGAFVRSKIRNLRTGAVIDRTFNAGIRVEQAILERKDMQFLYRDGDEYVFMDLESYDQQHVSPVALGDAADYMVENSVAIIAFYNGDIVTVGNRSFPLDSDKAEAAYQAKKVINGRKSMTFNLLPLRYKWAYDLYRTMKANHWEPEDIQMQKDVEQWQSEHGLSDVERWIIKMGIGYFSAAEGIVGDNIQHVVRELADDGRLVVVATHDPRLIGAVQKGGWTAYAMAGFKSDW